MGTKERTAWKPVMGSGLEKVKRILPVFGHHDWYALDHKIRGKTVFLRDHGTKTLYVVGTDGYAYSLQSWSWSIPYADIQALVRVAITGDLPAPRSAGIYRNLRVRS